MRANDSVLSHAAARAVDGRVSSDGYVRVFPFLMIPPHAQSYPVGAFGYRGLCFGGEREGEWGPTTRCAYLTLERVDLRQTRC